MTEFFIPFTQNDSIHLKSKYRKRIKRQKKPIQAEKEFNQSDLEAVNKDVSHTLQHILLTVQHKWNYKNWNK